MSAIATMYDQWDNGIVVWTDGDHQPDVVCINVDGPRGGHKAALRLNMAQANELATVLINAAERARAA